MKLLIENYQSVLFPADRWSFLRAPQKYLTGPDQFVWGVRVPELNNQLLCWHPLGSAITDGFDGLKLNVLCLKEDATELEAYGLFLKTSFQRQAPSDLEWTHSIRLLDEQWKWSIAEKGLPPYWADALIAAGLEAHLGTLATRAKYTYLTLDERKFCFSKKWDAATFDYVGSFPSDLRVQFLKLLQTFNLTAHQAKECSNFVLILHRRMGLEPAKKALSQAFKSAEELRASLFRLAQPELSRLSENRIDQLRKLQLPPRTSVFGDPSFEKDVLKITHNPRTTMDWELFSEWVARPEVTEKIRNLLDLYQ